MPALPVYKNLSEDDEQNFQKYVERVLMMAKDTWKAGHSDFVIAINAQTDQIIAVDRKEAINIIEEEAGTSNLGGTIGEPAGPLSVWVILLFRDGQVNTVNVMKMTFMPGTTRGQA